MLIVNEGELGFHAEKIVPKTWGTEFWLANTELYCLKILKIIPGFQCSIHCHKKKDETFIGISGAVLLAFHDLHGKKTTELAIGPGNCLRIEPKQYHSFTCHNVSWIMEVSTRHDDADVVRIQESRKLP